MARRQGREAPRRQYGKDNVVTMLAKGLHSAMSGPKKSLRKPAMHSRSFTPRSLHLYEQQQQAQLISGEEAIEDDEFFDEIISTSSMKRPLLPKTPSIRPSAQAASSQSRAPGRHGRGRVAPSTDSVDGTMSSTPWSVRRRQDQKPSVKRAVAPSTYRPSRGPEDNDDDDEGIDMPDWIEDLFDNSDRHALGMGVLEKMFGTAPGYTPESRKHRPFFTYWVTIIQIIVFIVSLAVYGIAPIGLSQTEIKGEVLMTSLTIQFVSYFEIDNLWIGPTQADLIHLGAKYSPCMRSDPNINEVLALDRQLEGSTACCYNNDGTGCVQTLERECFGLSTWLKWPRDNSAPGYTSGSVCGQDPRYCTEPASTGSFVWENDITTWPVCTNTSDVSGVTGVYHMVCEVVGRPCCYGIQGRCTVATREYCSFLKGYFHEEATLCSQVSCMNEICAMIDFVDPDSPDQFYRLFTSLFLSSGLLSLVITVLFQVIFQRDIEKLTGTCEMILLYVGGGMVGSLASVIFIPYFVETGPSGSQFAVLAAMFLEAVRWNKDDNPGRTLLQITLIMLILFLLGAVLAQVDNWAHLFGFFFGLLIAIGFRPFKTYKREEIGKVWIIVTRVVCFVIAAGLFTLLIILFYVAPLYDCEGCMYFNCIPFTENYCDAMSVNIGRTNNESYLLTA